MRCLLRAACTVRSVAVAGFFGFVLSGCDWEVSKVPLPRPSPTPTPSPTPANILPQAVLSPAAMPAPASATLPQLVALANAELITSASAAAVKEAAEFESAARKAAVAPVSASADLSAAIGSLARAKRSYQTAEAAVFYVDPESAGEVAAQPDPLEAGSDEVTSDAFAEVDRLLEQLARLTVEEGGDEQLQQVLGTLSDLADRSGRLRAGMQMMAEAWVPDAPTSFRENYFLASPDLAVARIFQGLLAQSGDILPRRWLKGEVAADEVRGRISALHDLYLGISEERPFGTGLHDLVFAAAPAQAMATHGAIAQAAALADALAVSPTDEQTRRKLLAALENVTRQLEISAAALGIRIIEVVE